MPLPKDGRMELSYVTEWTTSQLHISAGEGIGFSTNIPVDDQYLVKVPVDHPKAVMPLYISWPSNRKLSQATVFYRQPFCIPKEHHAIRAPAGRKDFVRQGIDYSVDELESDGIAADAEGCL